MILKFYNPDLGLVVAYSSREASVCITTRISPTTKRRANDDACPNTKAIAVLDEDVSHEGMMLHTVVY
jgi:hypothetical protein